MKIYAKTSDEEIEDIYKKISNNVKRIRKIKNVTQIDVALAMGFTTATFYTNAENYNDKHFNLEHLIRLSKILNVNINEFFK